MVDHEGHVKEIVWKYQETGEHEGNIFAVVNDYLPENAPDYLLPHPEDAAGAGPCPPVAVGISTGSALEMALAMVLVGVLLAFLYSLLSLRQRQTPDTPATAEDPSAPLTLADYPRFSQPDGPSCSNSSCVAKAEAFLRFAGLPYSKQVGYPDAAASPKGHLPFLDRGPQRITDSHFIIQHLVRSGAAPASLLYPPDPRDKAAAVAVAHMCDSDLASAVLHYRWVDDQGWARCQQALMGPYRMLLPVRMVVSRMIRKSCYVHTMEQGFGRHSNADRLALVEEQIGALSQLLGDRPFLFGDSPHAVDASAFAVLDEMLVRSMNPQLADLVDKYPNLVAYRERIRARFFGADYPQEVTWVDGDEANTASSRQPSAAKAAGAKLPEKEE